MKITNDIIYVGVNDHQVDLFEGQYVVPNGMAYNSYVIKDEKIAVMDTVDARFTHEWLDNVGMALKGAKPDYLIVQHMEPDHSANIYNFMKVYPDTTIVANTKTFVMMENFFRQMDLEGKKTGSGKWRYPDSWKACTDFRVCSHGTLAGSYGDLRQHR